MNIDFDRLNKLRYRMFDLIDREISRVGHHKSYEGNINIHLGNRWKPDEFYFELNCYCSPVISGRDWVFYTLDELEAKLDEWEAVGFDEETESYIYPEEQL